MKRPAVTVATVGAVALFVACGFPEVGFDAGVDAGGVDATGNHDAPVGAEGSGGDDARGDGTIADDGPGEAADSPGDAAGPGDGEASVAPEGGDSSTVADTGTDGDAAADAPAESGVVDSSADGQPADGGTDAPPDVHEAAVDAPPACDVDQDTYPAKGGTCGGTDCCDTDKQAHPGQTGFFTQTDACGSFDYNCDNQPTPQYPVNLKCGGTGLTGCTGGSGFLGDPGCGNPGLYGTCVPNGVLACQAGSEITVTQGCN